MDIKGFLSGLAAQGGTGGTHPVTKPDFTLSYENKDITGDIAPYLISFVYTDYLEGQSDELQVEFEDVDGRWLRGWYPEQGDALSLSLGDQFTGLVSFGKFEIVEIEYNHPPSTVSLKALAAGISKASRTLKGRAYENTTLAEIVRQVAARLKLEPSGQVKDIKIKRITQYQERDIEFLSRLAKEYGHTFKIVGNKLVFADNATLKEREVVVVLSPEDMTRIRLRDLIKGVPTQVEMRGFRNSGIQRFFVNGNRVRRYAFAAARRRPDEKTGSGYCNGAYHRRKSLCGALRYSGRGGPPRRYGL